MPYQVSGIEPVGSRSDGAGKRRKTADAPTYPRTMRTNATPTTASSSILVPPAVESLRRQELLGQRLDRFRSLAHDVGAERAGPAVLCVLPRRREPGNGNGRAP